MRIGPLYLDIDIIVIEVILNVLKWCIPYFVFYLVGICVYRKTSYHKASIFWFYGGIAFCALIHTVFAKTASDISSNEAASCLYLAAVILPIAIFGWCTVDNKKRYQEYLDEKIDALPPMSRKDALRLKAKLGHRRDQPGFENIPDFQMEVIRDMWRKEMRRKLYDPYEQHRLIKQWKKEAKPIDQ